MQMVRSWFFFFLIIEKKLFCYFLLKICYCDLYMQWIYWFHVFIFQIRYEKSICLKIIYSIVLISKSRVTSIVNRISWSKILEWQQFTQFFSQLVMWRVVNCEKKKIVGSCESTSSHLTTHHITSYGKLKIV